MRALFRSIVHALEAGQPVQLVSILAASGLGPPYPSAPAGLSSLFLNKPILAIVYSPKYDKPLVTLIIFQIWGFRKCQGYILG